MNPIRGVLSWFKSVWKWRKKKPVNPYKRLKSNITVSLILIGFGAGLIALPFWAWLNALFSRKVQLLLVVSSSPVGAVSNLMLFSLGCGVFLVTFGFVNLWLSFREYEKRQWMDY